MANGPIWMVLRSSRSGAPSLSVPSGIARGTNAAAARRMRRVAAPVTIGNAGSGVGCQSPMVRMAVREHQRQQAGVGGMSVQQIGGIRVAGSVSPASSGRPRSSRMRSPWHDSSMQVPPICCVPRWMQTRNAAFALNVLSSASAASGPETQAWVKPKRRSAQVETASRLALDDERGGRANSDRPISGISA